MAKENIVIFSKAIMIDKALAEKVAALAAKHGYGFTGDDLLEACAARPLSDAEMQRVTGGGFIPGRPLFP